jgi:lysophospholipase L1-like esterase
MRGLRLERPPRWGILTLVLLVIGNVVLFTVLGTRSAPADTYSSQQRSSAGSATADAPATAPAAPTAAPQAPQEAPVVAVYGDGYASGNDLGGRGAAGWPAVVADTTGAELALNAVPQAGYASIGVSGEDFPALVRSHPVAGADVVVLFGSRNDADEDPAVVESHIAETIQAVRQTAPQAGLVVVGPAWDDADVPGSVLAVRDLVRSAAQAAGAVFVDPVADGWFAQRPELIAPDGVSPTDEGHGYMAELLTPVVAAALQHAGAKPAA